MGFVGKSAKKSPTEKLPQALEELVADLGLQPAQVSEQARLGKASDVVQCDLSRDIGKPAPNAKWRVEAGACERCDQNRSQVVVHLIR